VLHYCRQIIQRAPLLVLILTLLLLLLRLLLLH
jgi:hypothetical protein